MLRWKGRLRRSSFFPSPDDKDHDRATLQTRDGDIYGLNSLWMPIVRARSGAAPLSRPRPCPAPVQPHSSHSGQNRTQTGKVEGRGRTFHPLTRRQIVRIHCRGEAFSLTFTTARVQFGVPAVDRLALPIRTRRTSSARSEELNSASLRASLCRMPPPLIS